MSGCANLVVTAIARIAVVAGVPSSALAFSQGAGCDDQVNWDCTTESDRTDERNSTGVIATSGHPRGFRRGRASQR